MDAVLEKTPRKTLDYITFINVVAACSVVFLHTNTCFWTYSREPYWITANFLECFFYFAVPAFFMVSGATLMDYQQRYSTKEFFKKRAVKTLIPFLAWSVFALFFALWRGWVSPSELSPLYILNGILGVSFNGIYWFFPALFSVYLCMPLFAAVSPEKREGVFTYLVAAGLIVNQAVPLAIRVLGLNLAWPLSVSVVSDLLIFTLLGWLLTNRSLSKKEKLLLYALALLGFCLQFFGTLRLSRQAGQVVSTYKGYGNVPGVLYSAGAFVLLKDLGEKLMRTRLARWLKALGSYTFSLYLIHWYVMQLVAAAFLRYLGKPQTSLYYRLGAPLIIIPITLAIAFVLRKIPLIKKLVP